MSNVLGRGLESKVAGREDAASGSVKKGPPRLDEVDGFVEGDSVRFLGDELEEVFGENEFVRNDAVVAGMEDENSTLFEPVDEHGDSLGWAREILEGRRAFARRAGKDGVIRRVRLGVVPLDER